MSEETKQQDRTIRTLTGQVTSISGSKTVTVEVNTKVRHPIYGKYTLRRTKVAVHDPNEQAKLGDVVQITSCRRLSKRKAHRLLKVVRPALTEQA